MTKIFEYIYYRLTKAYFKWDGRTGITAIIAVSMIQTLLFADLVTLVTRGFLNRVETAPYSKIIAYTFGVIMVIIIWINYNRYNGQYNMLSSRWKNETRRERILKGILVVILLILPWIPIIIIGVYY